jgi:transmembrane sensor
MERRSHMSALLPDETDWEALARYLAGESPPAEAEAMHRWLTADPRRWELFETLNRSINGLTAQAAPAIDVEGALRRVRARMDQPDVRPVPARRRLPVTSGPRRRVLGLRIAAAAVLVIAVASLWQRTQVSDSGRATISARVVATAVGKLDSIRLSDGSRVVLGPMSRLDVGEGFGVRHRDVNLAGEAHFEVHDAGSHPFTVHAGAAVIRDVGTAFSVRGDSGGSVRVVVTSGIVSMRAANVAPDSGVALREGDFGLLASDGRVVTGRADVADEVAWMRGRLIFRDTPLAEVGAALRRWYGITLRVEDQRLSNRHLTAAFDGETPAQVLDVVALTLGARLERRGDTAILRAAPPDHSPPR